MPITITAADLDASETLSTALLALNNDYAVELSWAEASHLRHLVYQAFFAARIGNADAMLIAFDQDADYRGTNFLWFRDRNPAFVYVDRVVTAAAARGRGHARTLYRSLIDRAREAGHDRIVCEVNSDPPNPASDAFHCSLGFVPVGSAVLGNGKTVSYLSLSLAR